MTTAPILKIFSKNVKPGREYNSKYILKLHTLNEKTDDKGLRVADFAVAKNLSVGSLLFSLKNIHQRS